VLTMQAMVPILRCVALFNWMISENLIGKVAVENGRIVISHYISVCLLFIWV
jgi:hypothetical protein